MYLIGWMKIIYSINKIFYLLDQNFIHLNENSQNSLFVE